MNDLTENILPAVERAIGDKSSKSKVLVIISDCCAHTHMGCECQLKECQIACLPKIGPKDSAQIRKAEVDRLYSCPICSKTFVGSDALLADVMKM